MERRRGWQEHAACKDVDDPELFFPEGNSKAANAQAEKAKKHCADCLVRDDCLDFALEYRQSGIWGGMTEAERDGVRRRRIRSIAGVALR